MISALRPECSHIKRLVVKVGSRYLADDHCTSGKKRIELLVDDIAALRSMGMSVVIVTSGAIAQGMAALGLDKRPSTIPLQQACAGIGQIRLMRVYEKLFAAHNITIGQVLLTWDDLRDKKRYLNLRNTLFQLLDLNVVPIINENDSVGVEEIKFGNNDTLGAQISLVVAADLMVNLTDVNGLYDKNPQLHKNAQHIPLVKKITPAMRAAAGKNESALSVGGMITKLNAIEDLTRAGIGALIADGFSMTLQEILSTPEAGTIFLPSEKRVPTRHRWIAFSGKAAGSVLVDEGATRAILSHGKSLLPAGVKSVNGEFREGDMVDILGPGHLIIARGLTHFCSADIRTIAGCKTSDIARLLGQKNFTEVVHRDNMVVLD